MTTKITSANIDATVASAADIAPIDSNAFNIGLLGFKMAVNEGLTVFNLVDGVVDEFNDESGIDEAEGSNDLYCGTSDFYQNLSVSPFCSSAGFTTSTITEPDTSTAGTNPGQSVLTSGSYTVPCGATSVTAYLWGAGGNGCGYTGGGGGFVSGNLAVTAGQTLHVGVGEVAGYGHKPGARAGGGVSFLMNTPASRCGPTQGMPGITTPQIYFIAGGGGGTSSAGHVGANAGPSAGAGGGTTGEAGRGGGNQTSANSGGGGGGSQSTGGQGGPGPGQTGNPGGFLVGGCIQDGNSGNGGAGYYGGGAGGSGTAQNTPGGGGSSYTSHPQITCGTNEDGDLGEGGGVTSPLYVCGTNEGIDGNGEDGYVLLTTSGCISSPGGSSTIVSNSFTSTSVPTTARIVVFEENVDTPTLNTDIIASVSRDGTNFTNATLSDSGYVTGSSGQRILTGQADISGQPSGQSMRWKLALANNTVKIHGVSLQWS